MFLSIAILKQRAEAYAIGQTLTNIPQMSYDDIINILSDEEGWHAYNDSLPVGEEDQAIYACEEYERCNGLELIQIIVEKYNSILWLFDDVVHS